MTIYHITSPDNINSILSNGIKPNDKGYVYGFTNIKERHNLALCGLPSRLMRFALFSFEYEGELESDNICSIKSGIRFKTSAIYADLIYKNCSLYSKQWGNV